MAEAILNKNGKGNFKAYSAGSKPSNDKYPKTNGVHPKAYKLIKASGYPVDNLHSKNWSKFIKHKDKIDFVFTLCDKAKNEVNEECPVFPGQPLTAHWGVPDPAEATGNEEEINRIFRDVFAIIKRRIDLFISLPLESLERLSLKQKLDDIGKSK